MQPSKTRLAFAPALLALALAGCLSHERADDAGVVTDASPALVDAATAIDSAASADAACVPRTAASVRFEPALAMGGAGIRVTLIGRESDPASNGVRLHLDVCGGSPPCPIDLVVSDVGDVLDALGDVPDASGTLDTDGSSYAVLHVADTRRCATCGGTLDVLAGRPAPGLDPDWTIATVGVDCSTGCGELRAVSVGGHGELLRGVPGETVVGTQVSLRVTSDYVSPCVVCDCAFPDMPASGLVVAATGVFAP
jgi:hypothetical protein